MKSVSGYIVAIAGILMMLLAEGFFTTIVFSFFKNGMRLRIEPGALWIGSCILTGCIFVTLVGFFVIGALNDGKKQ